MDILKSSRKRIDESNMELYRARFAGKLCIGFVCAVQYLPRTLTIVRVVSIKHKLEIAAFISMFILAMIVLVILAEYIIYRKIGPRIAKYTDLFDITLLLLYTMDWVLILIGSIRTIRPGGPPCFEVPAFYGFTMFAWRALLVTLIVQKWWLKIIPPSVATIVAGVYGIIYLPNDLFGNLVKSGFQLFNVIIILYCEDRIQWRMIWSSLQKDKWIQMNNFILNNIPENIMILDLGGGVNFISDYCKLFLKKCQIEDDGGRNAENLLGRIRNLHEQSQPEEELRNPEVIALQTERLTTQNELIVETNENNPNLIRVEALEDLVRNFRTIIVEKNLQERQFLAFNGKLRIENIQQDKSIEIKISYVHNIDNEYIILILRDTTQRDLLVRLEENNKYKDQLLASVSHELRAPLNGNINLIESAVNSLIIPEDLKESLLIPALRSGKFLLHIINDILDMSQIKEKKLRLVFQSCDLRETLKSAAQLVELQAKKKEIELVIELDPRLPKTFCTDYMRLSQIILNLLSNAIKFTRQGMVKLTAIPMVGDGRWVKITVEDSGIGISRGNLQKLFSSYTNIEFEERQMINPSGVGLGLNIASNLTDLLAPTGQAGISVTSVPNQGSIFSFIIEDKKEILNGRQLEKPLDLENSHEIADELPGRISLPQLQTLGTSTSMLPLINGGLESETLVCEVQCTCAKILIVDDNPFNTMAFETILSSLKINCDSVYSGSAAIQKLLNRQIKTCGENCRPYSVVFMDQEMPEMTGSEAVEEIRRLQREKLVPEMKMIGCTAHKAQEEVERFMESGLESCIFKPISVDIIRNILKDVLSD